MENGITPDAGDLIDGDADVIIDAGGTTGDTDACADGDKEKLSKIRN